MFSARNAFSISFLSVCLIAASPCFAQTAAQITGRITDQSDAVVPGAAVEVVSVDRGTTQRATSNDAGYYTFYSLDPGNYRITVQANGFRPVTRTGMKLDVNQSARVDFALELGAVSQQVEVTGENPLIEATTAQLGTVVSEEKIADLPLNARNFTQLLALTPGASPISTAMNSGGANTQQIGIRVFPAINGQSNRSNSFMLDGVYNNGNYQGTYAVAPSIDMLDQFKVQSHSDEAQFGTVSGGVVNIASKSGTNNYHGSAYEFLRNDKLDARNFFTASKQALRQNQFGATLGGPVIKNKIFFFFSYEGYQQVGASNILSLVPTPAQLNGDFSAVAQRLYDPATTRPNPSNPNLFVRDLFPGNIIPVSRLNKSDMAWAKAILPQPMDTGVMGYNSRNSEPQSYPANNYSFRVDHYITPRDNAWFRYTWGTQHQTVPQALPGTSTKYEIPGANMGGGYTHTLGANTVVTALFGQSSTYNHYKPFLSSADLLASGQFSGVTNMEGSNAPGIAVTGYFSTTRSAKNLGPQRSWQYHGDISHNMGRHSLKFGGEVVRNPWIVSATNANFTFNSRQTADLNNLGTTGNALASFLLGTFEQLDLSNSDYILQSQIASFWAQDSWKATDKLTVNVGLRWDLLWTPWYTKSFPGDWDFNTGKFLVGAAAPGPCSSVGKSPCLQNPNDPYLQQYVVFTGNSRLRPNNFRNLGPRLGLAYRLGSKTVLRASFGIFHDLIAGQNQQGQDGVSNNAGWPGTNGATVVTNATTIQRTADDPFGGTNPLLPPSNPALSTAYYYDPKFKNPYSQQWNFEIQKELANNFTMTAGYVGSHNLRMPVGGDYNTALTPGPGNYVTRAPFPQAPVTRYDRSIGQSYYEALQVKVERRAAKGLSYLLGYTWSKSIDIASSGQFGSEDESLQNPYDPRSGKSVSGFNVPHVLTTAVVYALPFGHGKQWLTSGPLSRVVSNWQLNAICTFRSGQPYTLFMNQDVANIGAKDQESRARPDLVGDWHVASPTPTAWFNKAAFASPQPFTFGSLGRNTFKSDALRNVDFSAFREDSLTERIRMQFRAEFFNAVNHPTFGVPQTVFTNPSFGRVTSTVSTARQIQLGLKVLF